METAQHLIADGDRCYRAVESRDRRFDGVFYTAVKTTGIYCRPSCPAITPRRHNVAFYVTPAAAQGAGFRACRRCRPDLTPGSPEWDVRADVAGRAMRMIADGVVEREGVEGLAARSGYTPRHLTRVLTAELGAGPLALARSHRAQTARILIETTDMPVSDIAFAAGFASVRQFNATVAEVYRASPTQLRRARRSLTPSLVSSSSTGSGRSSGPTGESIPTGSVGGGALAAVITLQLGVREPFDAATVLEFLTARAVQGTEQGSAAAYRRTLRLPHGFGIADLTPRSDTVQCRLQLSDLRDVSAAVERCRRLLDLDADPVAIDEHLATSERLAPLVAKRPGLRIPGAVDGFEAAVRAVVGQQISVGGARTIAGRLVHSYGDVVADEGDLTHVFPSPERLAEADPESFPMPKARGHALVRLANAVASGEVVLDRSADRASVQEALLSLKGIGPWTADYIALRALGDPDVFLSTDLGVRQGLAALGGTDDPLREAEHWRPWRSYALMHVWTAASSARETR